VKNHVPALAVLVTALSAALAAPAQDAAGPVAIPVKCTYRYIDTQPKEPQTRFAFDPFEKKTGCLITYLIAYENIKEIDTSSIAVTSITTGDGTEMPLKDSKGNPSWKSDGATHTYLGGKDAHILFTLFIPTDPGFIFATPKKAINVKGTISVTTGGEKTETETLTFKTAEKGQEQTAGPFTFSIPGADDHMTGFLKRQSHFVIQVEGDTKLIKDIFLTAGGQKITSQGSGSLGERPKRIVYIFASAPATPEFTLTVSYYTDGKTLTVPFGEFTTPAPDDLQW
jgi:hypothetical protein